MTGYPILEAIASTPDPPAHFTAAQRGYFYECRRHAIMLLATPGVRSSNGRRSDPARTRER